MPTESYVRFDGLPEILNGFTILFNTNYLAEAPGILFELPEFEVFHSSSGSDHTFVLDGLTYNYTGLISDWLSIAIVFKSQESTLSLFIDGSLVETKEYLRFAIPSGSVKIGDTKTARMSDFRIYSKVLSDDCITYYNNDSKGELLATGRLG